MEIAILLNQPVKKVMSVKQEYVKSMYADIKVQRVNMGINCHNIHITARHLDKTKENPDAIRI